MPRILIGVKVILSGIVAPATIAAKRAKIAALQLGPQVISAMEIGARDNIPVRAAKMLPVMVQPMSGTMSKTAICTMAGIQVNIAITLAQMAIAFIIPILMFRN